jgi:hypothetical protein
MRNKLLPAIAVIFISAGLVVVNAQQTTRLKTPDEKTPSWTYRGEWYGFLTCNRLQRRGNTVTPEEVKNCIAEGGTYILAGGGRTDVGPKEKCEPFAGQQVLVSGTMTSQKYGTGPTSDASIEGLYAGGDRPATKFDGVTVISMKVMPAEPRQGADPELGSRVSDAAQQ